jgi:Icc-related predicted phosphoesterase
MKTLVCIADTHMLHRNIEMPPGDFLVIAGDITHQGSISDVVEFDKWLMNIKDKYNHILMTPGNHDFYFEKRLDECKSILSGTAHVLVDEYIELDGVSFYGHPWQPWFYDWAYNLPRNGHEIQKKCDAIPWGTDVLISHGPPYGYQDTTQEGVWAGCQDLMHRANELKDLIIVCGHIHEGYGQSRTQNNSLVVNASICNRAYQPVNKPIVIEIEE